MPNQLTTSGLQTKTTQEVVADLTAGFQAIFGADINVASDTPDGQMINLFAQAVVDNLDLLAQIYNSFNPDLAFGRTLDQRCAINGIQRLGGTYTMQNVSVTTDRALNLQGLDTDIDNPDGTGYTVSDGSGNQWILAASQTISAAGTYSFAFRAKNSGAITTTPNTINTPVTIVLGVTAVNNPTAYSSLGIDEETDSQLRVRRQKSVSLSSSGYLQGLLAAILNINGVTSAFVYENTSGATDGDGIPSHSVWCIVQGGADADVAEAIYSKRNAGCGMKGSVIQTITQADGSLFQVKFDRTSTQNLYIEFDVSSLDGVNVPDATYIKTQLAALLAPGVNERVNVNEVATLVQQIDPNALVTNAGLSTSGSGPWVASLLPTAKNLQFAVLSANISVTVV